MNLLRLGIVRIRLHKINLTIDEKIWAKKQY